MFISKYDMITREEHVQTVFLFETWNKITQSFEPTQKHKTQTQNTAFLSTNTTQTQTQTQNTIQTQTQTQKKKEAKPQLKKILCTNK